MSETNTSEDLISYPCSLCSSERSECIYEATVGNEQFHPSQFICSNVGHGEHYRIVRCLECGMMYASPRPSEEALIAAYSCGDDQLYVEQEEGRRRTFRHVLQYIEPRAGKLLDVGCNTGVFLEEAQNLGYTTFGFEPSEAAVRRAREERGLEVRQGSVPCALPWQERFDVITLWDVLEHVSDPVGCLRFLGTHLAPGGRLHLSTLNIGCVYARISGRRWPWLMRMHLQYFTRDTLRQTLVKAGFSEITFRRYSHIVHADYLRAKLRHVAFPLRLLGLAGLACLQDRDGFVRVSLGDIVHVSAGSFSP